MGYYYLQNYCVIGKKFIINKINKYNFKLLAVDNVSFNYKIFDYLKCRCNLLNLRL